VARPQRTASIPVTTLALAIVLASCGSSNTSPAPPVTAATYPAPWQRTETRDPCDDFAPLRQPFFGDLHVHTRLSADATIFGTKVGPRDAYDFARGAEIAVADANEQPTRHARLERPLDFAAVTDHAEWYGEVDVCTTPGSPAYDLSICSLLRQVDDPADQFTATVQWLFPAGIPNPPPFLPFCSTPGVDCAGAKVSVWQEIQAAAEEAYDRTAACGFTSFIGFEHTASPVGRHLHRNVIFRNEHVTPYAPSQVDTAAGGIPYGLWSAIEELCLNAGTGCEALIIPHNPNLSGGEQFFDPVDAADAQRRQDREPLVELHQLKGNSECRYDRLAGHGVGTADELCAFEQLPNADQVPGNQPPPIDEYPRRNMVRNALEDGLAFEQTLGANPFKFGFIGSTDTHDATPGNVDERGWEGGTGNNDATPQRQIGDLVHNNPGGLAVVWAEENSRDALFAALKRRETYATSGTRPVVRFFAGDLSGVRCGAGNFATAAYTTGTPMGGDIGPVHGAASPRFAVLAVKDPGTAAHPGTDLQRAQIVKGWVDADGQTHERVFDVAGDANNDAAVDPATCTPTGQGAAELCAVWEDPDFDPAQRAFYYVRMLENPTCRWSTYVCKAAGVDPFSPDCAAQATAADPAFANCCLTQANDPFVSPVIQERAWTSPIWYRPDAIARIDGGVDFGAAPGTDQLELAIRLGALPTGVDPAQQPLSLAVTDDDVIFTVTLPAGALVSDAAQSRWVAADPGAVGLDAAILEQLSTGEALLTVRTLERDLTAADRVDHFVQVDLSIGSYRASYTRRWIYIGSHLGPSTS
jgi:hypothetical protein